MPSPYDVSVAGVTFEGRQSVLARLYEAQRSGAKLIGKLVREPANQYDSNALQVWAGTDDTGFSPVGYVPRHLAARLAPLVDGGTSVTVSNLQIVLGGKVDRTRFNARVRIEVKEVA